MRTLWKPAGLGSWRDEWITLDGLPVCGACQSLTERVGMLRSMEQVAEAAQSMAAEGGCEPPSAHLMAMIDRERARVDAQIETARELEAIGEAR